MCVCVRVCVCVCVRVCVWCVRVCVGHYVIVIIHQLQPWDHLFIPSTVDNAMSEVRMYGMYTQLYVDI